jgi:segregation and condensation protein B
VKRLPVVPREQRPGIVESILFVADEPVPLTSLAKVLRCRKEEVEDALATLESSYSERGIVLQRSDGVVQLVSIPAAGPYIERFLGFESKQRLSTAALESLAIIAYRQPLTRAAIEAIRGVNSDSAIASLIARGLVEEVGRAPGPGRPALIGTTLRFLEHFGLKTPSDLPPLAAGEAAIAEALDDVDVSEA